MKIHHSPLAALLLLLLPVGGAGAATDDPAQPDWTAANLAAVERHAVPAYRRLAEATAELEGRLHALCRAPDEAGLTAAREGYHLAMDGWQGVQHIRFGPVERFLRYHRFQMWPDKHNTGSKQLSRMLAERDPQALDRERFSDASVAVQGLSALERLLFSAELADFGDGGEASYRCRLSETVAANLAGMARGTLEEWGDYRQVIAGAAGGNDEFDSEREVTARWLNNLHTQLLSIVDQKLGRPLGEGRVKPRRAESWRSRRSLRDVALDLAAVEGLYRAAFQPLVGVNPEAGDGDAAILAAFAEARAAVAAIDRPLVDIAADPAYRPALDRLREATAALARVVGERLPAAIGIPLGFNSLDGD